MGKAVFQNVLQNSLSGKTRVLVTHALHFLPQVDYIYALVDGRIAERGTYAELMRGSGEFARFVHEFGSKEEEEEREEEAVEGGADAKEGAGARKDAPPDAGMMQTEERNTGAISGAVYREYLRSGRGPVVLPFLLFSLVFIQVFTILSNYW